MNAPSPHRCSLTVRPYECDVYGHVNNAVYQNYLEFARGEFLKSSGSNYHKFVQDGFGIWVVETHLYYRFPAYPDDELTIETKSTEIQTATAIVEQNIYQSTPEGDGKHILKATVKLVWVDSKGKPIRIPEDWKACFTPTPL